MGEDANIELVRRLLAAIEAGDDGAVDELVHPLHRDHAEGGAAIRAAGRLADRRIVLEDIIASGDRVVARIRVSATQAGDGAADAVEPGHRVEVEHIHIWRVAEGRLAEHWMAGGGLGAMSDSATGALGRRR
jgi:ketosteroid isomerase-like protein